MVIGDTRTPDSITINGVISNSNTAGKTLTIYSNGNITQNADLGSGSFALGNVYLYMDWDKSGTATYDYDQGTVYANTGGSGRAVE